MAISQNFPGISPTLNLNFARSKKLDPRITFTRSSSATRVNSQGLIETVGSNVPRFEHSFNSSTGTVSSLGLLIEEQRTNLLKYSNSFNTGGAGNWTPVSATCVFTQNVTGPDGVANSAWTIDDQSTAGDGAGFEQQITITPSTSTNYCLSIFVKQGTSTSFDFYAFFTGTSVKGTQLRYNFSTDTVSVAGADGGGITPTIFGRTVYPNGWIRIYFVVNDANSGLNNTLLYRIYPALRDAGFTGTTLFYGAQCEIGSFPTSYIPTTTATVTRSADNASMTGTNFSSWYNQSEGTLFSTFNSSRIADSPDSFYVWNLVQSGTSYIALRSASGYTPDRLFPACVVSGSAQFSGEGTATTGYLTMPITFTKNAFAYKSSDFSNSWLGRSVYSTSSGNLPTPTSIEFGKESSASYLNGTISQLLYYPRRLTNTQLQALTR